AADRTVVMVRRHRVEGAPVAGQAPEAAAGWLRALEALDTGGRRITKRHPHGAACDAQSTRELPLDVRPCRHGDPPARSAARARWYTAPARRTGLHGPENGGSHDAVPDLRAPRSLPAAGRRRHRRRAGAAAVRND